MSDPCTWEPPRPWDQLSFDEVEAAGLDGTLRTVGMKLVSFAAARQLRYVRLCRDLGWRGDDCRDLEQWCDQSPNDYFAPPQIAGYPRDHNRFALIETSRYGQTWVTLHDSADEAANANVNQEYAEDWLDPTITDLANGNVYEVEYRAVPILIAKGGST